MLTVLTNIRSTKVLHHASCIAGRRLRFGMLTDLTNVRSTKALWKRWKTTFGGRRPTVEDDLHWKTTFNGKTSFEKCW